MNSPRDFRRFERGDLEQSLGSRFESQVEWEPDGLAVRYGGASVTYGELNAAANRIAHAILAARGDAAEPEPVAVIIGQGITLLAAILGVVKAGKLYVPLELAGPRDRLAAMLADSRAQLVIAPSSAAPLLRDLARAHFEVVDPDCLDPALPVCNPGLAVSPDAPAYVYFTTGSTGAPKGVVDTHRNVLHNVMRYTNGLRIAPDDRLTLLQSPSFSGAVSSMFGALLNGATSCPFDVRESSSSALADYILREGITIYHSVPAIFRSFLSGDANFPSVRIIRLEGDQATALDIELFRRHFAPHCALVNGLGTTETGLVSRHFIPHDAMPETGVVPVGLPVEDMRVLILDGDGGPLPAGGTGEIAVCSDYLALGYWHRPELTERAFVAGPDARSTRMYRTGDLGRLRPDGCLMHLGRLDSRLKIRGMTIDLADVEAALIGLSSLREAAVNVQRDENGELRLYACYVPAAGHAPTISAIRKGLAATLPPPSIPSRFERVDALPRNENLKIERRALPVPSPVRPRLEAPYVAPQDPTQARIVGIWESLLGIAPIGIHDDFGDLGGDSLLATQVAARVTEALGVECPPSLLATAATVAEIAAAVADGGRKAVAVVALRADGTKPPFYFLHGDYLGTGMYCSGIARSLDADQPFFSLAPLGLDGGDLPDTIEEMAERHLCVLREHRPRGPYRLGGNCNGGLVALEIATRLMEAGERVERLVIFRTSARNAAQRPLLELMAPVLRWWDDRPAARRAVERRLRWFAETWAERDAIGRLQLVAGKVASLARTFGDVRAAQRQAHVERDREAPRPRAPHRDALIAVYGAAAADYVPPRYGGRIDLLWPAVDAESPHDALAAWKRVAANVHLEVVPGDHLTAITVHAEEFARCLAGRLADEPPGAHAP